MLLACACVHYFVPSSSRNAFLNSFLAIFLLWTSYIFYIDTVNEGLLSTKIAMLFGLPNKYFLIFINGILGGILAGLAGMLGWFAKVSLRK